MQVDEHSRYTAVPFLLVRDDTYKYFTLASLLSIFYRCTPPFIGYVTISATTIDNIYSVSICNNFNSYMEYYLSY